MYGAGFAAIVFGILFFFPIKNPILFIVINGICYLGASGFQVLIWAMVNDAIDYQELTTGDRKEGMVYATYSFFRKLASAVSSSLSSFTLALIGYNVNEAVQTAAVKAHIWKSYTAIYAIGYLIAVLILYFVYPLSKKKTEEMLETLAKKRANKENNTMIRYTEIKNQKNTYSTGNVKYFRMESAILRSYSTFTDSAAAYPVINTHIHILPAFWKQTESPVFALTSTAAEKVTENSKK